MLHWTCVKCVFDIKQYICAVGKTYVKRRSMACVARVSRLLTHVKCSLRHV